MATPASWIATRPALEVEPARRALARWWGIDADIGDLPSERDRNLLVRPLDRSGPYVLKVANLLETPDFLDCQAGAMARLASAGVPVARIVPARDGQELVELGDPGPPLARLVTWLPGRPLVAVEDPSDALLADLGATMGRSATALLEYRHPAADRDFQWDVRRATTVIARGLPDVADPDRRDRLGRLLADLRAGLDPVMADLRQSPIHNDANDHNVLVDGAGERVAGLLDFGDMCHSVTAQEAAVAMAYAMFHRDDPLTVVGPMLGAFDAACPLTSAEVAAMPWLILARLGASVAISAHQARLDPDPYLRISEAPAWELLERLDGAGRAMLTEAVRAAVGP